MLHVTCYIKALLSMGKQGTKSFARDFYSRNTIVRKEKFEFEGILIIISILFLFLIGVRSGFFGIWQTFSVNICLRPLE